MFDSRMTCKSFLALTVALCGLAAKAAEDTRVPFADPYVLYHDGVYYAYGTYRSNEGIGVATSRDLKSWNWWQGKAKDGFALHHGNSFGTKHYWAPEVYSRDGRFVMYHSASLHVCASVAESPLGPFRTPDLKPILPTEATSSPAGCAKGSNEASFYRWIPHLPRFTNLVRWSVPKFSSFF